MIEVRPGDAFLCQVNAHRHQWNGEICRDPASWNCGTQPDSFRSDYCANGDSRCYHLALFRSTEPRFVVHCSGADWLLENRAEVLDDQLLLFWGLTPSEPNGVTPQSYGAETVVGAYRVRKAWRDERNNWVLEPHADGWVDMSELRIRRPYFRNAGGKYFKRVERGALIRLFKSAQEKAELPRRSVPFAGRKRLQGFCENLDDWLNVAAERMRSIIANESAPSPAPERAGGGRTMPALSAPVKPAAPAPAVPEPAASPAPARRARLLPDSVASDMARLYGRETITALELALCLKPLILLAGPPGCGKSNLAMRLIDDPKRARTLVVPVASTWRGSEDLLGHVNPIDDEFAATPFTHFLLRAATAWNEGDREPRHVVFEEFNLSRPEFWMSEILARSQYDSAAVADRTIHLGGRRIQGLDGGPTTVFLSPAVRFIGTLNSDPASPPLTTRVLDRAALVHLDLDPRVALDIAGVQTSDEVVDAIYELDCVVRERGVGFSMRAALSLASIADRAADFGLDTWQALDRVLCQEVLSKVALYAADPADSRLVERLVDWSTGLGSRLTHSGQTVSDWNERLSNGLDVQQT